MKIPFTKYHGAGNDFIIIDFRPISLNIDFSHLARRLCNRQYAIGADGLILLFESTLADYQMRIFNADGSEAAMCGNGIRCLFDFIHKQGSALPSAMIETLHGVLRCRWCTGEIVVDLGSPKLLHWPIKTVQGEAFVVDTGVPHAVLFVDDLNRINVHDLGAKIRFASHFEPHGVNVNFACLLENEKVAIRTYERGVETETLACGTGAAAVAFVAMKQRRIASSISILTRLSFDQNPISYQEELRFQFYTNEKGDTGIEMLGKAVEVFGGLVDTKDLNLLKS